MQNEYENDDIILSFHGTKGFHSSQLDSSAAMLQKHKIFIPYMHVLLRMKSELLKLK
jgi:hypothetical protein